MTAKRLFLASVLIPVLIGLYAAAVRYRSHGSVPAAAATLPPFAEEYRRIMDRYNNPDSAMDLSGSIRIYDGGNKFSLKEQPTFRYTRSGHQFYSRLSRLQSFCDGQLILQLDTLTKTISLSRAPDPSHASGGLAKNANPGAAPFDRMLADTARFGITGTVAPQAGGRTLRINSEYNPEMRSISIDYDTTTYRLQRAEGEWWKQAPLIGNNTDDNIWLAKIEYSYGRPVALDMRAKIDAIVTVKGNTATLMPAYKDYQLNNRLNDR